MRRIPNNAVSVTLKIILGNRTDVRQISKANQRNIVWELFSDKYARERDLSYDLQVTVVGMSIEDEPVRWGSSNLSHVDMPDGFIKHLDPVQIDIPPAPVEKIETVNRYIREFVE